MDHAKAWLAPASIAQATNGFPWQLQWFAAKDMELKYQQVRNIVKMEAKQKQYKDSQPLAV